MKVPFITLGLPTLAYTAIQLAAAPVAKALWQKWHLLRLAV
jgi:hypothetical protein